MASIKKYETDGDTFWRVRWREGGKGRAGRSRQRDHQREGDAKKHLRDVQEIEDRRKGGKAQGDGRWTVEQFYEDKFLPLKTTQVSGPTINGYKRRWAPAVETRPNRRPRRETAWHLRRAWGPWRLEDITYEAVMDWHATMKRAGASPAQMYRAHDLLVSILNHAVRLRYLPNNEALACRPSYQPKRTVGVWRPDTIERVRQVFIDKAASGRSDFRWRRDRDAVMVAVLAYAGLRPGEVLALTWQNLEAKSLWVTHSIAGHEAEEADGIEDGRTKTGVDRTVPLEPFLRDLLVAWKLRVGRHTQASPIFPADRDTDRVWTYRQWLNWRGQVWTRALAEAGVDYKKPYHLRHSCISMWIAAGVVLPVVAKRAGNSVAVCAKTYTHAFETYDDDERLNVAEAFAAARADRENPRPALRAVS